MTESDRTKEEIMRDWRAIRDHKEAISGRLADAVVKALSDRGVFLRTNEARFHEEFRGLIERYL